MVMVDTNSQTTKTVEWRNITVGATSDSQQIVCANAGPVTLDAAPGGELLLGYITIKMENISSGEVLYNGTLSDFSSYTFTVDESNMIQYTLYLLSADNSCKNKNLTFVIKVAGLDADTVVISTADVSINMNDGHPILSQYEYEYWNGITKKFFITNDSTVPVYARLYLDNVSGSLADSVTVSVYDGDTNFGAVWNKGAGGRLFVALPNVLRIWERKDLTVVFSVESGAHGEMQFQLACDIVQTTNNPEHIYDGKFTNSGSTALNIIHQMAYFEHFCMNNTNENRHTVTFKDESGNIVYKVTVPNGESLSAPPIPPAKTDYLFAGWYANLNEHLPLEFPYTPTADVTLKPKYVARDQSAEGETTTYYISESAKYDLVLRSLSDLQTLTEADSIDIVFHGISRSTGSYYVSPRDRDTVKYFSRLYVGKKSLTDDTIVVCLIDPNGETFMLFDGTTRDANSVEFVFLQRYTKGEDNPETDILLSSAIKAKFDKVFEFRITTDL